MMIKAGHSWRVAKLWEGWTGQTLWEGVGWVGRRRSFQGPLCDRELVSVCVCVWAEGWFPAGENESHRRLLIREEMKFGEVNLPSTCRMD